MTKFQVGSWYYVEIYHQTHTDFKTDWMVMHIWRMKKRRSGNHIYSCHVTDFRHQMVGKGAIEEIYSHIDFKEITEDQARLAILLYGP